MGNTNMSGEKFVIYSSVFSGDGTDTAIQRLVCGNKNTVSSFHIHLFSLECWSESYFSLFRGFLCWELNENRNQNHGWRKQNVDLRNCRLSLSSSLVNVMEHGCLQSMHIKSLTSLKHKLYSISIVTFSYCLSRKNWQKRNFFSLRE